MQDSASIPKGDLWTELDKKKKENIKYKKIDTSLLRLTYQNRKVGINKAHQNSFKEVSPNCPLESQIANCKINLKSENEQNKSKLIPTNSSFPIKAEIQSLGILPQMSF